MGAAPESYFEDAYHIAVAVLHEMESFELELPPYIVRKKAINNIYYREHTQNYHVLELPPYCEERPKA